MTNPDEAVKVEALVAELRVAAEKATSGPWRAVEFGSTGTYHIKYGHDGCWLADVHLGDDTPDGRAETSATAELIALANPVNILTLLASHAAQAEETKAAEAAADEWAGRFDEAQARATSAEAQVAAQAEIIASQTRALRVAALALKLGCEKTQGSGLGITSDLFGARLSVCAALGISWETGHALNKARPVTGEQSQ